MRRVSTKHPLLSHVVLLGTAALLVTASGCTPDEAGQAATALAAELGWQLLAFWIL